MNYPSKETVAMLRERYPKGTRIALVQMDDPYTKLRPGDKGIVDHVDDAGGIHISWDRGEGLAAIWGQDVIRKITPVPADDGHGLLAQVKRSDGQVVTVYVPDKSSDE